MENEIIKLFREFKLGNSLFKDVIRVSPEEQKYHDTSDIDYEKIIQHECRERLANFFLFHEESAMKVTKNEDGSTEYRTELIVFKMEDFKTIIEAVISMLPDSKIQEIKQGKTFK